MLLCARPLWPLDRGESIRGCHLAQSMRNLGVRVGVASQQPPDVNIPQTLEQIIIPFSDGDDVIDLVKLHKPAAVVGLDPHSLPLLASLRDRTETKLVWYPSDDPVRLCLSTARRGRLARIGEALSQLKRQRTEVGRIDGVIAASEFDASMLRHLSGAKHATMLRPGVDTQYFEPVRGFPYRSHKHLVFWGRLDAHHNIEGLNWFCKRVWPVIKGLCPSLRLSIVGRNAGAAVTDLAQRSGITVTGEMNDIRPAIADAAITIMPQFSGPAVCNALLEGAAMGRPIVTSSYATRNLTFDGPDQPMLICGAADEWIEAICRLWADVAIMEKLGRAARTWAVRHHRWDACTVNLLAWLEAIPGEEVASIIDRHERRRAVLHRTAAPSLAREAA